MRGDSSAMPATPPATIEGELGTSTTYHRSSMNERVCPNCGYDLREQFRRDRDSVVCPECGKSVRVQDCLIPQIFSWKVPILCVALPQVLAAFTMLGLRGENAPGVPLLVFGAGCAGTIAASVTGAVRTWRRVGERLPRGRRIGWTIAAVFENGFVAGVTAFILMFPIMVLALIWRDTTK